MLATIKSRKAGWISNLLGIESSTGSDEKSECGSTGAIRLTSLILNRLKGLRAGLSVLAMERESRCPVTSKLTHSDAVQRKWKKSLPLVNRLRFRLSCCPTSMIPFHTGQGTHVKDHACQFVVGSRFDQSRPKFLPISQPVEADLHGPVIGFIPCK